MLLGWLFAANFGLWGNYFKSSDIGLKIHGFFMLLTTLFTVSSGVLVFVNFGFKFGSLHRKLGFIIIVCVVLIYMAGNFCASIRKQPKMNPSYVKLTNLVHRIGGWILLLIVWVQLLLSYKKETNKFYFILILNTVSFGLYILLNYILKKRAPSTNSKANKDSLNVIKDLSTLKGDYFIFGNTIYDINLIQASHPGGWELIKAIKEREVDRYIYGTETI